MSSGELGSADTAVTSAPSPAQSDPPTITPLTNTTEWRPYPFEHPLTAATSAMLNISGASDDPTSGFGILYDYHYGKMGQLGHMPHLSHADAHGHKSEKTLSADIWSPVVVSSIESGKGNGDMGEVYAPPSLHSSKLSVLRRGGEAKIQKLSQNGQRYSNGELSPHQPIHSPSGGHPPGVIILKEEGPRSPGSPRNGITSLHLSSPPTPLNPTSVSPNDDQGEYQSPQLFATLSNPNHPPHPHPSPYDFVGSGQFGASVRGGVYPLGNSPTEPYYRVDFFANEFGASGVTTASRQLSPYDGGPETGSSFVDRYVRGGAYKQGQSALPADLPSPDSGIGADAIAPRDATNIQQAFDYSDLCQQNILGEMGGANGRASPAHSHHSQSHSQLKSTRPWHDFGRQNEGDKIQIPKLFSNFGFRYYLESPISTSQRREDDRITYINKGQFYGISLDFIPQPDKQIKSQTVKTVVMLVFREEKSPEDEIKAWQFWHGRQHSVKQRILDADTKNSVGLVGCIDEIAHNAIAVYWNPMESSAKINVAVQCLSTDFSSQKGVKGLPLHLQIDTYDDPRDPNCPLAHRAYCQIKVFCDKGAERKTRDEERRAAKRKLTANGRKKVEDLYHTSAERSEFYAMSDLTKPPVLFTPAEDIDKLTSLELHGFYSTNSDGSEHSVGVGGGQDERLRGVREGGAEEQSPPRSPQHTHLLPHQGGTILKFHHNFPPDSPPSYIRHTNSLNLSNQGQGSGSANSPPLPTHHPVSVISNDKTKEVSESDGSASSAHELSSGENSVIFSTSPNSSLKRMRLLPPPSQRLMIYVREESEEAFTPLHLVPPTKDALLKALEEKYAISLESLTNVLRRNSKGVVVKVDDEMLQHYCHEDSFLLHISRDSDKGVMDITLIQTPDNL